MFVKEINKIGKEYRERIYKEYLGMNISDIQERIL
jgi:hypothetical protein